VDSHTDSEPAHFPSPDPLPTFSHTADGSNGWNVNSPVTETVTASDGGSGLDGSPSCTVDEVPATLSGSGPWTFSVSGDGSHDVSWAVPASALQSHAYPASVLLV